MGSVVLRNVTVLFLLNLPDLGLEVFVFLHIVLVSLVARYKYNILVEVAEAHLRPNRIPRRMAHSLSRHTTILVHLPDVHCLLGFRAQGDQKLVVLGAEGHRHKRLVLLDLRRADNLALTERFRV